MHALPATAEPALAAFRILTAIETGNLADLECLLERAQQLAAHPEPSAGSQGERLELLDAVSGEIRHSITRFGRRLAPELEGMEVSVRLLRHLALPPCGPRRGPGRQASRAGGPTT